MQTIISGDISADYSVKSPPAFVNGIFLPFIAPGQTINLNLEVTLMWEQVKGDTVGNKILPIKITILSWDRSTGRRHMTIYTLFATQGNILTQTTDITTVAPNVRLGQRQTTTDSVWLLRLQDHLRDWKTKLRKFCKPKSPDNERSQVDNESERETTGEQ